MLSIIKKKKQKNNSFQSFLKTLGKIAIYFDIGGGWWWWVSDCWKKFQKNLSHFGEGLFLNPVSFEEFPHVGSNIT